MARNELGSGRYINREMSWLEFNRRVLSRAENGDLPLLERVRFLSISASNLDEFFMVRIGSLSMASKARDGRRKRDITGLTPGEQLKMLYPETRHMMERMHSLWSEGLSRELADAGIRHLVPDDLSLEQERFISLLFTTEILPVISPIALSGSTPFPLLRNLSQYIIVHLKRPDVPEAESRFALLPLDRYGGRVVRIPSEEGFCYLFREEIAVRFASRWFPGYSVEEAALFRVTRNADFAVSEEEAPDLVTGMMEVLEERKSGDWVRVEIGSGASPLLMETIKDSFGLEQKMVFSLLRPLDLTGLSTLADLEGMDHLKVEPMTPLPSVRVCPSDPMFDQIARRDILLYHPYESYDPVVRFIREAAADPGTLAVKIALYRTSAGSPVIEALKTASDNGINVTVLLELKARFDEQRNISWARDLESRGIQVIYGVKGLKTHAKICLVVRREPLGIRRYCHFATGNYNEVTARFYGDLSFFTCDQELGEDASVFFNALCGYSQPAGFNRISMAPVNLRESLMDLIDSEIQSARNGEEAGITAKLNSIVDKGIIDKLYEASSAGVKINLNVRGICCLVPGVPGISENIRVTGIVDGFLEHARIVSFFNGGRPRIHITSADWMPRNLNERLELLVPVEDPDLSARLLHILQTHVNDTESSWQMEPDGSYAPLAGKGRSLRSQEVIYREVEEENRLAGKRATTRFKPHISSP